MAQMQDSTHPTGVATTDNNPSASASRARERKANAALVMRMSRASWSDIAEVIGYPTARAAKVAVELAMERNLSVEDKGKLRQMVQASLDALVHSVAPKSLDPESPEHLAAVGRHREILADFRRLWGLDAPQEVLISNPTQRELDDWVGLAVSNGVPDVEEDDIVDGEVLEDKVS